MDIPSLIHSINQIYSSLW